MSWKYFSGLLGVALTVKAAGGKRIILHGPPNGAELMKLTRHFADDKTTDVVQSEILTKPFTDENFKVTAFELHNLKSPDSDEPSAKRAHLNRPEEIRPTYAYLFQAFRVSNKLDLKKCIEHGIPTAILRSPAIKKLIEGDSLILPDGKVISPSDVTMEAPKGRNILVIDCPSEEFIPPLLDNESLFDALSSTSEFNQNKASEILDPGISLVVHFLPKGLFDSPNYQKLQQRLNSYAQPCEESSEGDESGVQHLVLDGQGSLPPVSGIYTQSTVLNSYFDETVYPRLANLKVTQSIYDTLNCVKPFSKVAIGEALMKYYLRPHGGFFTESCIRLDEEQLVNDVFDPLYVSKDEATPALEQMRREIACVSEKRKSSANFAHSTRDWPELTFLGTASSSPSKYRNVSGILFRIDDDSCILLDCGEGSLNQLYALHGTEETHRLLRGLKLILLTHMHADHHGGIFSIAIKRRDLLLETQNTPDPLPILAPTSFVKWSESFAQLFKDPCIYVFSITTLFKPPDELLLQAMSPTTFPTDAETNNETPAISPIWSVNDNLTVIAKSWNKILQDLKIKIGPVKVPHTGTSWAFVIESLPDTTADTVNESDHWKIVYSGDTPPCGQLVEAGRGCDLLIHEATMANGYEELAVKARHSTMSEAVAVGRAMQAKFILLNHFSQRFACLPNFDTFHEDLAPTFDFMRIKLSDLWKLPYILPYYKSVFVKHWGIQQTRSDARQYRKIRSEEASKNGQSVVLESVGEN